MSSPAAGDPLSAVLVPPQLARFRGDPTSRGTVLDTGLWRYTRHPNYFGDACVWWGLWLLAAGSWVAGLLYDHFGYYAPAFAIGIVANILNLLMVSVLVGRQRHRAVYA